MQQQFQTADLKCDHRDHYGQQVQSLCVRAQCNAKSACCQKCQLLFHRECHDNIHFFEQVPQLVGQIQNLEEVYQNLVLNVNQTLKCIKKSLDALFLPIKNFESSPNLGNLNRLGDLLRLNPSEALSQYIRQSQKVISDELINLLNNFELITEKPTNGPTERQKDEAEKQIRDFEQLIKVDEQKALICIEKAIYFVSNNEKYWCKQGHCLQMLNRQQGAIESFDRSIQIKPSVEAYVRKTVSLNMSDRINEAISCCQEGLAQFENSYKLKLLLNTYQDNQIRQENQ